MITSLCWIPPGAPRRIPLRHELSAEEAALALAKARAAAGLPIDDGTPAGRAAAAAAAASQAASSGASAAEVRLAQGVAAAKAAEAEAARRAAPPSSASISLASNPAVAAMMKAAKLPPGLADLEDEDADEAGDAADEDDDIPDAEFESMLDTAADGGATMSFSSTHYTDQRLDPHSTALGGAAAAARPTASAFGLSETGMFDDEDDEDEEDADALEAKPGDSFFVAARTDEDWSCAEVYCYVRDDATMYVHHDIALPAMPMALAWSDCPPARTADDCGVPLATAPVGSYLAVGSMRPGIEIWNLDVTDPLEPSMVLGGAMEEQLPRQRAAISAAASGSAASRAGLAPGSHTEAVLTLAWNRVHRQLLASGSADHTVKLWDMRRGSPIHTWSHHAALVQSVAWHPSVGAESSVLASGSADGTVAVIDARAATGAVLRMPTGAEVEALAWNPHDASSLFVTTQAGVLMALDVRKPTAPVLSLQACKGECASLSVAPRIPGIVATGGSDGVARIWDVSAGPGSATSVGSVGRAVASKAMAVGPLFSAHWLPHADGILAGAGGNGLVAIWDIPNDDARATAALKPRLIPVEAVPSLAVRRRENGQPLTGATTAASATAASSGVVTAAPKTASSASSSSAADGGLMAETSAAIADARRHGAAIEAARAQAARSGVAAGAAGSADFGAMMEAAASSSSSAATVEGGKSKGGKGKGRKGKVVRKAKHK